MQHQEITNAQDIGCASTVGKNYEQDVICKGLLALHELKALPMIVTSSRCFAHLQFVQKRGGR